MTAVPFDHTQAKCNGSKSNITGRDMPMCITCGRLTMRPNAPIKGRVFATSGGLDCEHWSPNHVPTVSPQAGVGEPLCSHPATNETGRP
jgi:hypothetical protein